MRKMSKVFAGLAAMAAAVVLVMPVQAAPYTYTVRVFPGNRGTIDGAGADGAVVDDEAGVVTFDPGKVVDGVDKPATVTVGGVPHDINVNPNEEDSIYYAKGIRISGKDSMSHSYNKIDADVDYVIAYGILSDRVEYTVRYLDTNGNELEKPITYYGNAGDKPVVPCLNIDGYVPNAYNITGTLNKGKENVFEFIYTRRATGGGGGGDTTVYDEEIVTTTNTTPVIVPGAGDDAAAGDTAGGNAVTVVPGDGDAADAGAGAGAGDAGEAAAPEEPQELIDLDDEEVPLANIPGSNGGGLGVGSEPGSFFVNMPPAVIVGVVSMAVLVIAAAWYLLFMRKKKGTGEDEQE